MEESILAKLIVSQIFGIPAAVVSNMMWSSLFGSTPAVVPLVAWLLVSVYVITKL